MLQVLQRKRSRSNKWLNLIEKRDIIKNSSSGVSSKSVSFARKEGSPIIKMLISYVDIYPRQARLLLAKLMATVLNIREKWQERSKEPGF